LKVNIAFHLLTGGGCTLCSVAAVKNTASFRPMSHMQLCWATLSCHLVAQQSCTGNCQFFTSKQSPNKHGFWWHRRRHNYQ